MTNAFYTALFNDPQIANLFSTNHSIAQMIAFEKALTGALADQGLCTATAAQCAMAGYDSFAPDMAAIQTATAIDGLPVPELVRQLKTHAGPAAKGAIHSGATSQDLMDTVLAQGVQELSNLLETRLQGVIADLGTLSDRFGDHELMGRTRMQAALPVSVAHRIEQWRAPLEQHLQRLQQLRPRTEVLQLGGPVGTRESFHGKGDAIAKLLARELGLHNSACWHTARAGLAEYAGWLSLVSGSLGKTGQDISLMAQQGIDEITLSGGGGSSAMPHKQNPILAETLVSMARYNAVLLGGMHQALVHEQERSGMGWALEWLCLPQMAEITGKGLSLASRLIGQIERVG
jgi:3-carboxy-cis,cis-muconate cycloisomerase